MLANSPASCGGTAALAPKISMSVQDAIPSTTEASAPWGVARFQNTPAASGTKAPTSVRVA